MPHADPNDYPVSIPDAAFHLDTDAVEDYRLPCTLDEDYLLFQDTNTETPPVLLWWVRASARLNPVVLEQEHIDEAVSIAKDCRIQDQDTEILQLQVQVANAAAPAATPVAPKLNIRLGTPHTFTGITNAQGVYDPTPRNFARNVRNYLMVQEAQSHVALNDHDRIEVQKVQAWEQAVLRNPTLVYMGPMRSLDSFLEGLLKQFKDIDIKKTAIHKISIITQGTNSAEVHWTPHNNGQFHPWGSVAQPAQQQQQAQQPYRGPAPMDIDAMTCDSRCFKCGKTDGHFASNCPTPITEIRRRWGRDSMYTPGGLAVQNRGTNFANVGEYLNAMSQEQREELAHALQAGGAQGANQTPQVPAPQGFASGLS
ncbi:hypothetical protein PENSPDRAFT_694070 [Peniophora sp. CONT]|nr:hypothetical protein PENSPDRAFT_694070 [Peniophora sp. CONT]